jgi:hypothetical protein
VESCCRDYQPVVQTARDASAIAAVAAVAAVAAGVDADAVVVDVAGAGNASDDSFVGAVGTVFVQYSSASCNYVHSDSWNGAVGTEDFSVDEVDEEAEGYMDLAAHRRGGDGNDKIAHVA